MRILVTGSRDWDDIYEIICALEDAVLEWLEGAGIELIPGILYNADVTVVHGACPTGADLIADNQAKSMCWNVEDHPADWRKHGKAAGPIRNQEMVDAGADICLAFIKDNSRGATGCAEMAEKAGIPVRRYTA